MAILGLRRLHGPGRPHDAIQTFGASLAIVGHRQPLRVAQAPRHADDHPHHRENKVGPDGLEAPR